MNMSDPKDRPLQFSQLPSNSKDQPQPHYAAVVAGTMDEELNPEQLDLLQLELEEILSAVVKRMVMLDDETSALSDWSDKKDKKTPGKGREETQPTAEKRGRPSEDKPEKPSKKMKESSGKVGSTPTHAGPGRPPKAKKMQEYEFTDDPATNEPIPPRIIRNDAPDRFWASVEPYCADITPEDMKALDSLIKTPDDDSDMYKIPALGKHYSLRWAAEDLLDEQKEGSKLDKKKCSSSPNDKEVKGLLKKADNSMDDNYCPYGQLTQRLISALVEENIMTPIEDIIMETASKDDNGEGSLTNGDGNGDKSFYVGRTKVLEARIREELIQQGLLDADEPLGDLEEDEVLAELEKRQAELRALSAHNRAQKDKLIRLAKEQMKRQEIQKKIRAADNETMEAFRRIMAAKQKKRSPTKKEREQAQKALKDREALLQQLDAL